MNDLLEWLTVEDPLIRLVLQIIGASVVIFSLLAFVLIRATDPPYKGVRRRPWGYRGPAPAEEPVGDHTRPIERPAWAQPSFAMPTITHHRARIGPREDTRVLHPGYVNQARAMVRECDMYPSEEDDDQ